MFAIEQFNSKMKDDLIKELGKLNVTLTENLKSPEFSDFILSHGSKIIGYGWKTDNSDKEIGFMYYCGPAIGGERVGRFDNIPEDLDFTESINLFQFAISEDFFWYIYPTDRRITGHGQKPCKDFKDLISDINSFINNDYDPTIFHDRLG